MPRRLILFFSTLLVFNINQSFSQHSDCKTALVYDSKRQGAITIPEGYGEEKEIFGHPIYNEHYFTEEHNTLWIYLYFRDSTEFEFELNPKKENDDFDFMLYKIDRPNFCNYIKNNQPLPIRSNLARKNSISGSITGMRSNYSNSYAKAGDQPFFSSTLKVNKGDEFYLLIDSPYGADGNFKLYSECTFIDTNVLPKNSILQNEKIKTAQSLVTEKKQPYITVMFTDDSLNQIPYNDIIHDGIAPEDSLCLFDKDSLKFKSLKLPQKYEFIVTADGFEQQKFIYRCTKLKDTLLSFALKPIKIGSMLKLEDIRFVPDKAVIISESISEITKLISFLMVNKNIDVEIGGHVNGLGKNRMKYNSLSKNRAKAVYKELVKSGIKEERLSYIGHGNKKPVFINPSTFEQSSANRRVEITVVNIR